MGKKYIISQSQLYYYFKLVSGDMNLIYTYVASIVPQAIDLNLPTPAPLIIIFVRYYFCPHLKNGLCRRSLKTNGDDI